MQTGQDVVIQNLDNSGKTFAYLIAIVNQLQVGALTRSAMSFCRTVEHTWLSVCSRQPPNLKPLAFVLNLNVMPDSLSMDGCKLPFSTAICLCQHCPQPYSPYAFSQIGNC